MNSKRVISFTVTVMILAGIALAISQNDNQSELLTRMRSDDWKERAAAVEKVIADRKAVRSGDVRNSLINLLDRENQEIASAYREGRPVSEKYGEAYSEYYLRC